MSVERLISDIEAMRRLRKMSKSDLARLSGVSVQHLSRILGGKSDPGVGLLEKVGNVVGLGLVFSVK